MVWTPYPIIGAGVSSATILIHISHPQMGKRWLVNNEAKRSPQPSFVSHSLRDFSLLAVFGAHCHPNNV